MPTRFGKAKSLPTNHPSVFCEDPTPLDDFVVKTDRYGRLVPNSLYSRHSTQPTPSLPTEPDGTNHMGGSHEVLNRRKARFGKSYSDSNRVLGSKRSASSAPGNRSRARKARSPTRYASRPQAESFDREDMPVIIGECLVVEKDFYRLLDQPCPENVRPLPILRKALELVLEKKEAGAKPIYLWSQLKSIRQDLSIQGINTDFTVKVYETHAR